MKKSLLALSVAVVFLFLAGIAGANVTSLNAGEKSVCKDASWIIYNNDESRDTTVVFDIGPWGYSWGKTMKRVMAPGGYQAGSIARKTTFENKGPGNVSVNCQRQRFDRNDWKIDPGSGSTYQSDYRTDHVIPGTYIEPGMGQPEGTERGIFGGAGTGDGGTVGERYR